MLIADRARCRRSVKLIVVALAATLAASCSSTPPKSMVAVRKQQSKEYFPESVYGVKASPRVTNKRAGLPRGGGRDQLGKPYMIRGKMYYPKEDKNYRKVGKASWYGDAFHGRLTANGEIYDMTNLTAAHPTMPLPSYARVTNTKNGSSVIVRVNDRGPYSNGRVIDLSKRAAEMLDYAHSGTASVLVEYVGRAPLDGQDDSYLMASYRPGNQAPDPSDGLPTGVMIAMNGSTPSGGAGSMVVASAFPGEMRDVAPALDNAVLALPDAGPIAPARPAYDLVLPEQPQLAMANLSYAPQGNRASAAFAALEGVPAGQSAWKTDDAAPAATSEFIAAGSFVDAELAMQLAETLAAFGRPVVDTAIEDGQTLYNVSLLPDGRRSVDDMLAATWASGAADAIVVRE